MDDIWMLVWGHQEVHYIPRTVNRKRGKEELMKSQVKLRE